MGLLSKKIKELTPVEIREAGWNALKTQLGLYCS